MQKYQGFLLATVGGLAAAGSAQAADMPVKAPLMAAPPAPVWTGWYIGGHAGGAWQHTTAGYAGQVASGSSFIGGGQIGYNWQRGNFVFGLEADGSWLSKGPRQIDITKGTLGVTSDIKWLATARARLGLAVNDTMLYMTGGLAVGKVRGQVDPDGDGTPGDGEVKSVSKTRVGWVVGGGIEHMWSRNWTIGLEALFVDLGKTDSGLNSDGKASRFSHQAVIGRVKLNYKF